MLVQHSLSASNGFFANPSRLYPKKVARAAVVFFSVGCLLVSVDFRDKLVSSTFGKACYAPPATRSQSGSVTDLLSNEAIRLTDHRLLVESGSPTFSPTNSQAPTTSSPPSKSLSPTSAQTDVPTRFPRLLPDLTASPVAVTESPVGSPSTLSPTNRPNPIPTAKPTFALFRPSLLITSITSLAPTKLPSLSPTKSPTSSPTTAPTTVKPTDAPSTIEPSPAPTPRPTPQPSQRPVNADPTAQPISVTFRPGFLTVTENGLRLSEGLTSRIFAESGEKAKYADGGQSSDTVHRNPDFGAAYWDERDSNKGGWIYVSNSEVRASGEGSVGAFTFNSKGELIDYRRVLENSRGNCGGGETPWGAWISCEEVDSGQVWQVDPTGRRQAGVITPGKSGDRFESFTHDLLSKDSPQFFLTVDKSNGAYYRFRPNNPDWSDPWSILYGSGTTDYLLLDPNSNTFSWTTDKEQAEANAADNFPEAEGTDCAKSRLYFVSKSKRLLFTLDLNGGTYTSESTLHGAFEGSPDALRAILPDDDKYVWFTEDEGDLPGIHARNRNAQYFSVIDGPGFAGDESTGLAFSPNLKHLYFAMQDNGVIFDVTRTDGLPFSGMTLNIKYHNAANVFS